MDIDVMPVVSSADSTSTEANFVSATSCTSVKFVAEVAPRSLLLLGSVDGIGGKLVSQYMAAVGASYGKAAVMATASSLYIASYNSEWTCAEAPGCDGWWCGFSSQRQCSFSELSAILAFDVDGATGALALRATGSVPGYLLSQWAMSEHDGHLRVAYTRSTCGDWWWGAGGPCTDNLVDVLRASDLDLASSRSRLQGLGVGETIYAVRFEGDIGFVVTFRQVDPLFTLDLSDPFSPKVLGELKITGYSDYLHLIDDKTLLGIGKEATEDGRVLGVKLALFDVRNMSEPTEVKQRPTGFASMQVTRDIGRAPFCMLAHHRPPVSPLSPLHARCLPHLVTSVSPSSAFRPHPWRAGLILSRRR